MEPKKAGGKRSGQKYKSFLVWQILLENTDENHTLSSGAIKDKLADYGIEAEEHSIRRDITMLQELFESAAEQDLLPETLSKLDYEIEYDASLKGYKISRRPFELEDLRLLAATVHSSKFITKRAEESLIDIIKSLCSLEQGKEIDYETCVMDREKVKNPSMTANISVINQAIKSNQQIKFQYLYYTLQNREQQIPRKNGNDYVVSPYHLLINDGCYYLLAFDGKKDKTFRIDRMRKTALLPSPREGSEQMKNLNVREYTKKTFSMFGGTESRVSIRFINPMLDTVIDRFGANGGSYFADGNKHFIFSGKVQISEKFYAWVCSFGKKATIVSPPEVVDGMKTYLQGIIEKYD